VGAAGDAALPQALKVAELVAVTPPAVTVDTEEMGRWESLATSRCAAPPDEPGWVPRILVALVPLAVVICWVAVGTSAIPCVWSATVIPGWSTL
jgi:hypothetical protein